MALKTFLPKLIKGSAIGALVSAGSFYAYTWQCKWPAIDITNDSILSSDLFNKYNPEKNLTSIDVCVRRIQLSRLRPDLAEDAKRGGSKLLEEFSGGLWGGTVFSAQRRVWAKFFSADAECSTNLWEPVQIRASRYDVGTTVINHLSVVSKTPRSIIFRVGHSPGIDVDKIREIDSLLEVAIEPDLEQGVVDLSVKTANYWGTSEVARDKAPMEEVDWLHKRYTEILLESAIRYLKA